jgi:Crinkler effector protein N-terminal domain
MPYTILCIITGETTPFSVTIDETQSVGELKDAIKKETEPELNAFDAHTLTLYRIDVNGSNNESTRELQKISQDPSKNEELDPLDKLRDVFKPTGPTHQMIQILVQPPGGESIDPRTCGDIAKIGKCSRFHI